MRVFTKFIIASVLLFCVSSADAQVNIEVIEDVKTMSRGEYAAYTIAIPQIDSKTFEKNWEKKLKEGNKEKVVKSNDEISIPNAINKRISSEPLNIYSRFYETESGLELIVFFEDGAGFISSETNSEKSSSIKKILKEFGEDMYRIAVETEMESESEILKGLEKDLDKMIKDNEKMHKDISSYERDIERKNGEIIENVSDQSRKTNEIEMQKDIVFKLKDALEEQQDEADKKLKELERARKKMKKDNESLHKDIDNLEAKIRDREREIVKNNEEQKLKMSEISSQKATIQDIKKKLKSI